AGLQCGGGVREEAPHAVGGPEGGVLADQTRELAGELVVFGGDADGALQLLDALLLGAQAAREGLVALAPQPLFEGVDQVRPAPVVMGRLGLLGAALVSRMNCCSRRARSTGSSGGGGNRLGAWSSPPSGAGCSTIWASSGRGNGACRVLRLLRRKI